MAFFDSLKRKLTSTAITTDNGPEVRQRLLRLLNDETRQNETLPPEIRDKLLMFDDPDQGFCFPDATLGRDRHNPVCVNSLLGEMTYLSSLRSMEGAPFFFHRVGSLDMGNRPPVDVYELVSADRKIWTFMYMCFYFKKKTRHVPQGFRMVAQCGGITGTNRAMPYFPQGIHYWIDQAGKNLFGKPCKEPLLANVKVEKWIRPEEHSVDHFNLKMECDPEWQAMSRKAGRNVTPKIVRREKKS